MDALGRDLGGPTKLTTPVIGALTPALHLTAPASQRLRHLQAEHGGGALRIGVRPSGCAGLRYRLTWAAHPAPDDQVVTDQGLTVLVERAAMALLTGATLDYAATALTAEFHLDNPNEASRCGCGDSFRVCQATGSR